MPQKMKRFEVSLVEMLATKTIRVRVCLPIGNPDNASYVLRGRQWTQLNHILRYSDSTSHTAIAIQMLPCHTHAMRTIPIPYTPRRVPTQAPYAISSLYPHTVSRYSVIHPRVFAFKVNFCIHIRSFDGELNNLFWASSWMGKGAATGRD